MAIIKKSLMCFLLIIGFAAPALAQDQAAGTTPPPPQPPALTVDKEAIHLNAIGTFSGGFVLQSYGYIGVLADVLSKGVYEPDVVSSMLDENVIYLNNVNTQLRKYQGSGITLAPADAQFMQNIIRIIDLLAEEARALSSFAKTNSKDDLNRYSNARKEAWKAIESTLDMK